MKLSRNLNPEGIVQNWLPTDLAQDLMELATGQKSGSGEASPLFGAPPPTINGEKSSGGVLKGDLDVQSAPWEPGHFGQDRLAKETSAWQPAVRYHTAANAADLATQLITDARRQADDIIRQAEQQAKSIQEQAYQDGWNTSMGELQGHFATAKSLVQETIAWRDELMSQSEPIILELVRNVAQKLFGEGFVLDSETLQSTFTRVLENARSLGNLRVYVNPDDATLLGPYWREYQESISSHQIEVIPSSSISRGGCYVNGQWGSADGRIETQLKALMETLTPQDENGTEKE